MSLPESTPIAPATAGIGSRLPNLALPRLDGHVVHLDDFRDRRLLLFFWGSW